MREVVSGKSFGNDGSMVGMNGDAVGRELACHPAANAGVITGQWFIATVEEVHRCVPTTSEIVSNADAGCAATDDGDG